MKIKSKDLINIICFVGIFVIMSVLINSSKDSLGRVIPAILLVWSANNVVLIIQNYLNKDK